MDSKKSNGFMLCEERDGRINASSWKNDDMLNYKLEIGFFNNGEYKNKKLFIMEDEIKRVINVLKNIYRSTIEKEMG